jgi:serine/threonine-protein phosphatase PGAM5
MKPLSRLVFGLAMAVLSALPARALEERRMALPGGGEMAYVDRGAGEPALVLIHCGNCRKEIWSETIDAFAGERRVVAMDLVGHGASSPRVEGASIPALGGDVAALVEQLGIGRAILVGNSLGGPVALEAASRLGPERVAGIVAVDTLQNVEQIWPAESLRQVAESYRRDFGAACRQHISGLLPATASEAARERIARDTCGNDPASFLAVFQTIGTYDQAAALEAAGVPVRAINATTFPTAVESNRRHSPGFDVVLMEGVGHYPQIEQPAEFQRHLHRWVDELGALPVPPKAARTLWLVRHGAYDESDPRDETVGKGLVPIGIAQAKLAGARLAGLPFGFDSIFVSPMTRARETAAVIVADLPGRSLEIVPDLAECTPPTRRQDIMKEEKAEDLAACAAQLERLEQRLFRPAYGRERHDLVVAHGNLIRSLVVAALDVDPLSWLVMSIGHASVTVIRIEPGGEPRLIAVGDVGHLPPNLQTGRVGDPAPALAVPAGTAGKP